jgi:glycosyltransferase involved in cell wall biosynthesis
LRRYEKIDARVKVIDPGKVYQATARNIGIRAATGEFIMFCDSDDKYSPGMCRRMLEVIIQENVDLVACDCNVIVENGHNRPREDIEYKYLKIFGHWRIKDAISRNIESINVLLWNKIYKKSTIDRYGIILPDGCEYDDDAFLFQYLSVSDSFYGLDESLYIYRARENSVMDKVHKHKIEKTIYDMFKIQKHKADFVARNKLKDKVWKYFTALLNNDVRRAYDFILLSPEEKLKGLEVLNETLEYINTRLQCNFKISIGNIEVNEYRHD